MQTIKQLTINNISIREYFSMEDTTKYDIFLEHMNPENLFCGKKCNTSALTFDEVQILRSIFSDPNPEDLKDLYLLLFSIRGDRHTSPDEIFYNESIFQLFKATNYIKEYIKGINKKEMEWLSGEDNDVLKMLNAGERLAPFNHLLKKIDLAERFGVTPDEVGRWKYLKVFNMLAGLGVRSEIQKEFSEIK